MWAPGGSHLPGTALTCATHTCAHRLAASNLACLHEQAGQVEKALDLLMQGAASDGKNMACIYNLARVCPHAQARCGVPPHRRLTARAMASSRLILLSLVQIHHYTMANLEIAQGLYAQVLALAKEQGSSLDAEGQEIARRTEEQQRVLLLHACAHARVRHHPPVATLAPVATLTAASRSEALFAR